MRYIICLFLLLGIIPLEANLKILALSGSTREESFNKKLVEDAAKMAREMGATVTVIDLRNFQMPFYDGDIEKQGMPEKAKELRQLMISSDAIIISTPEYNGSVSAVLKNAIDWATRSDGQGSRSAFKGKKFALMSTSPGKGGGQRALSHLKDVIQDAGGEVVPIQVAISNAYTAFDANGLVEGPGKLQLKKEIGQLFPAQN